MHHVMAQWQEGASFVCNRPQSRIADVFQGSNKGLSASRPTRVRRVNSGTEHDQFPQRVLCDGRLQDNVSNGTG